VAQVIRGAASNGLLSSDRSCPITAEKWSGNLDAVNLPSAPRDIRWQVSATPIVTRPGRSPGACLCFEDTATRYVMGYGRLHINPIRHRASRLDFSVTAGSGDHDWGLASFEP
jgi:hypothetical protein